MVARPNHPSIGPFRQIRLKPNKQGYYEVWWTDAARGYVTRRESCRTTVLAQAQAYLAAFCDAARQAPQGVTTPAPQRLTIAVLCGRWLDEALAAGKAQSLRYLMRSLERELGTLTPDQLDRAMLQRYRRGGQPQVSGGTIRRELGALQTVLRWAVKEKLTPGGDVPSFDGLLPPGGAPRSKFLDRSQEQWFWDQALLWGRQGDATARRVMIFTALAMETAARRTAILELTWDRVNLVIGDIDYRVPGQRVTKKRRVRVPISDRLRPVLEEARRQAPTDPSGSAVGTVVGLTVATLGFARFTKAIGMPWVTPHVLRHTWASLAAMAGVPLYDVGQILGDNIATVEANYLHLSPGHLRGAINFKETAAPSAPLPLRIAS